jgi:hypothetical protein
VRRILCVWMLFIVAIGVVVAASKPTMAAGAEVARAPRRPTVRVEPSRRVRVGDVVTISGTFPREPADADPRVYFCAERLLEDGAPYDWLGDPPGGGHPTDPPPDPRDQACTTEHLPLSPDEHGRYRVEARVPTAAAPVVWVGGPSVEQQAWRSAMTRISIVPPDGPTVDVWASPEVYAGEIVEVVGFVYPVPSSRAVTVQTCSADVLADPRDPALVDDACADAGSVSLPVNDVGRIDGWVRAQAGAEATWVGAPTARGLAAAAHPIDVHDPGPVISPDSGLSDGQVVRVLVPDTAWYHDTWRIAQCEAGVVAYLPTDYWLDTYCDLGAAVVVSRPEGQSAVSAEFTVSADIVAGSPESEWPVACDAGPGACVIVVEAVGFDSPTAAAPITFAAPSPPP